MIKMIFDSHYLNFDTVCLKIMRVRKGPFTQLFLKVNTLAEMKKKLLLDSLDRNLFLRILSKDVSAGIRSNPGKER